MEANKLAKEIYEWLRQKGMWIDVTMYFEGVAMSSNSHHGMTEGKKGLLPDTYWYDNEDPREYFEYVRSENILSMSFEGPLYHVLNAYVPGWERLESEFNAIFDKYGLYPQMGNAWNLTAYRKDD